MGDTDLSVFQKLALEEYKALRAESLALNTALSTTLWVSLVAMAASVWGFFSINDIEVACRAVWLVLLLNVESIAATVTFLSYSWKYIRAGAYIRLRIEPSLATGSDRPLQWEETIDSPPARASEFYYVSVVLLQLPILVSAGCLALLGLRRLGLIDWIRSFRILHYIPHTSVMSVADTIVSSFSASVLMVAILFVNGAVVYSARRRIRAIDRVLSRGLPVGPSFVDRLSVVIPSRRDPRIGDSLEVLRTLAEGHNILLQIIVAGESSFQLPPPVEFVPVTPPEKGECIQAGLKRAEHDCVLLCDADGPVGVRDILRLVNASVDRDIAWGHRYASEAALLNRGPLLRGLASHCFRVFVRWNFAVLRGWDTQCGVKVVRGDLGRALVLACEVTGLAFDVELAARAVQRDAVVAQVPVAWRHRPGGHVRLRRDVPAMISQVWTIKRILVGPSWLRRLIRYLNAW
jgi:hypothetical protein